MDDTKNYTIRTRHTVSGHYHQQSFSDFSLEEAKRCALADNPNSEIVGVWPYVWTQPNPCE